jgi:hypothetical protein
MMTEKRYIICSAVKYKDHIIHGRRHGDAYQTLEKLLPKEEYDQITRENTIAGFVDQYGDFYDRKEAYVIADAADQIKYGKGTQEAEDKVILNVDGKEWEYNGEPLLISEHLFPDKEEF